MIEKSGWKTRAAVFGKLYEQSYSGSAATPGLQRIGSYAWTTVDHHGHIH